MGTPVQRDDTATVPTRADPALVMALIRAFQYQHLLDEGLYAPISEMAQGERIERGYLGSLLRPTLLVPDIVWAILDGRAPADLTLPRLLEPFSTTWAEQYVLSEGAQAPSSGRLAAWEKQPDPSRRSIRSG